MADTKLILVVDDEADTITYLKTVLEDKGYRTVTATDGNDAMAKTKSEKPDLITLDMSMPNKSGIKFFQELKNDAKLKKIPVVVVTAVTGFGDSSEAFKKFMSSRSQFPPPEGFVAKPAKAEDLLAAVAKLIG
jgi:CheY-like chemotaxis protein